MNEDIEKDNDDNDTSLEGISTDTGYDVHNNHGTGKTETEANQSETSESEQDKSSQLGENQSNSDFNSETEKSESTTTESGPKIEWDEEYYKFAKDALKPKYDDNGKLLDYYDSQFGLDYMGAKRDVEVYQRRYDDNPVAGNEKKLNKAKEAFDKLEHQKDELQKYIDAYEAYVAKQPKSEATTAIEKSDYDKAHDNWTEATQALQDSRRQLTKAKIAAKMGLDDPITDSSPDSVKEAQARVAEAERLVAETKQELDKQTKLKTEAGINTAFDKYNAIENASSDLEKAKLANEALQANPLVNVPGVGTKYNDSVINEIEEMLKGLSEYESNTNTSAYDTSDLDKYLEEYWKSHKNDNLPLAQGVRIGERYVQTSKEIQELADKKWNELLPEIRDLNTEWRQTTDPQQKQGLEKQMDNLYEEVKKIDNALNKEESDFETLTKKLQQAKNDALAGKEVDLEGLQEKYKTVVSDVYQNEKNKIDSDKLGYHSYQKQTIEDFKKEYQEIQKLQAETPDSTMEKDFWQKVADWAVASEKACGNALGAYADLSLTSDLGFMSKSDFYNKLGIEKPNKSDYENKEDYKSAVQDYKNLWKEYKNSERTKEYLVLKDSRDMAYAMATYAAQNGAEINGTEFSNQGVIEWYSPRANPNIIENLKVGTINLFKELGNDIVDFFVPGEYRPFDKTETPDKDEWKNVAISLYENPVKSFTVTSEIMDYEYISRNIIQNEDIYNATLGDLKTRKGLIAESLKLFSDGAYWTNATNQQEKAMNSALKNLVASIYYSCSGNKEAADHALIKSSIIMAAYFPKEAQDTQMSKLADTFGLVSNGEITDDDLEETITSQIEADSEIENDIPVDSENQELINSIYAKASNADKYGEWNRGLEKDLKTNIENDELLRRQYSK